MPGSVMAMAVIELARGRCPGSQRRLLLLVAEVQEVRQADVVVQRDPEAGAAEPGAAGSPRR